MSSYAGRSALILAAAVLLAVAGFVAYRYLEAARARPLLDPGNETAVELGRTVYAQQCASCHGAELEGQPNWRERLPNGRLPAPPHDASGHTWHHTDQQLFALTKHGPAALIGNGYQSDMPAFADLLSEEEIIAALTYIKSTWPAEIRARHDAINGRQP